MLAPRNVTGFKSWALEIARHRIDRANKYLFSLSFSPTSYLSLSSSFLFYEFVFSFRLECNRFPPSFSDQLTP